MAYPYRRLQGELCYPQNNMNIELTPYCLPVYDFYDDTTCFTIFPLMLSPHYTSTYL